MQLKEKKAGQKKAKSLRSAKRAAKQNAKLYAAKLKQQEKITKQQNEDAKKKLKKESAPKTAQQQIKYKNMFDSGICEVEEGLYSKTFKFSDINYQTAKREDQIDIFSRYCEALNYCSPEIQLQIMIINRRIDKDTFKRNMFSPLCNDILDEHRNEMNTMLSSKALEGQNDIIREKYFTFSTPAPSYNAAIPVLSRLESDFGSHFKSLGCQIKPLSGEERLELIHNQYRPDDRFDFSYDQIITSGLTTKAVVTPDSFDFSFKDIYFFGDYVGQCLYLKDLPADLTDKLITDLSDLPINMTIVMNISCVDQADALDLVRGQIAFMELEMTNKQISASQKGLTNTSLAIPMETRRSYDEATELLDDLQNKNQRMFKVSMIFYTYAKDVDALNQNSYQITAMARKSGVKISKLDFQQREAMNSIMPVGKNHVLIKRTLTTASTAIFIPFTTQELFQSGGMYYGLNALSHNLIMFNRKTLKAPNGFILGTPGSGKSFAAKREMINVLLNDPNSEVIIIDPEREYTSLSQGFDGEVVHISANSKSYINPLDITIDYADDDDPILLKSEFVISLCNLLAGGKNGLDTKQISVIDRTCKLTYQNYFSNQSKCPMPTLRDFYKVLKEQPESEAQGLALSLELYIEGTLSVFSHHTNVDTQKRLVIYDVRDLGKQLRTMGMLIVLDQIWNRITQNRAVGKRTWIYIDEIQLLFQNEYSATYFFELWSRARKWGAIPTGITQNVETLLLSDQARRMLSNSDFVMMLNQATSDRVELAALLDISNRQMSYIKSSGEGCGLLYAGGAIIPFVDDFPKNTRLYQMMTTKLDEVTRAS